LTVAAVETEEVSLHDMQMQSKLAKAVRKYFIFFWFKNKTNYKILFLQMTQKTCVARAL